MKLKLIISLVIMITLLVIVVVDIIRFSRLHDHDMKEKEYNRNQ